MRACGRPQSHVDPACLNFHRAWRNAHTASAAQVREPLRKDTARAPFYGGLFIPLREALGTVST